MKLLPHCPAIRNVLILKADRVYAEALRRAVKRVVPAAAIRTVHTIQDAAAALAEAPVDLLLTGVGMPDGGILDFLSVYLVEPRRVSRVLVVTARRDQRIMAGLNGLPIQGVFDPWTEDQQRLRVALRAVVAGAGYWSPSVLERIQRDCLSPASLCRRLSAAEQLVLSILGDGSDDNFAAELLGLKPSAISSVCRSLHRKLGVRHRGELVRFAVQHGFVRLLPGRVVRPGFATMLAAWQDRRKRRQAATARSAA